jgi:hypothetical protein
MRPRVAARWPVSGAFAGGDEGGWCTDERASLAASFARALRAWDASGCLRSMRFASWSWRLPLHTGALIASVATRPRVAARSPMSGATCSDEGGRELLIQSRGQCGAANRRTLDPRTDNALHIGVLTATFRPAAPARCGAFVDERRIVERRRRRPRGDAKRSSSPLGPAAPPTATRTTRSAHRSIRFARLELDLIAPADPFGDSARIRHLNPVRYSRVILARVWRTDLRLFS